MRYPSDGCKIYGTDDINYNIIDKMGEWDFYTQNNGMW